MSRALDNDASKENQGNSLYAALARTLTRGAALYFSRPVRLFRPTKISGWNSLRGVAVQEGVSFSPTFVARLIRTEGFLVIPKHFFPPLIVNACLGTILWTTYAETSAALANHMNLHPISVAALSGGVAGGMQAIVAAPAENVRLAIEGGVANGRGWSHAWKEVFRRTASTSHTSKQEQIEEIRQVRRWMKEVGDMAGNGWKGWGWGFAKDVCGFATFFSIFEITRGMATRMRTISRDLVDSVYPNNSSIHRQAPRVVHGVTLVSGGVIAGLAYELLSRPWDVARRQVHLDQSHSLATNSPRNYTISILARKLRDDGPLSFFQLPASLHEESPSTGVGRRRLYTTLRTLARVGPWGVGFLVWEAFGPGEGLIVEQQSSW